MPTDCTRRSFFGVLGALCALPILGQVVSQPQARRPVLYGDGVHDDTVALQAWFDGKPVFWANSGERVGTHLTGEKFRVEWALDARDWSRRGGGSFTSNEVRWS